jgi:hypothetical protein
MVNAVKYASNLEVIHKALEVLYGADFYEDALSDEYDKTIHTLEGFSDKLYKIVKDQDIERLKNWKELSKK